MRLPSWLRVHRTRSNVGTVTVDLVADTSRFEAAMHDAASTIRYRQAVAHERSLGRAYVGVKLDELARSCGLDPVHAWRLPRQRDQLLDRLASQDRATRQAAEAAWLAEHREHRAQVVTRREVDPE